MASLNLAGKTSGYVKVTAPDDSSTNPTVVLPTESGELALKSDITGGGGGIPEAPIDGKQYARKDADWSEVEASGGGSTPTPEDLVWEEYPIGATDPVTHRTHDTVYTNTNEVPLYLMVSTACSSPSSTNYMELYIDDTSVGRIGGRADTVMDTDTFLIPSGSTYEFKRDGGGIDFYKWNEARMPLAIAVGDASGGEATGTPSSFARIVDEKPENTDGGDATNGIQDRTLNKIEYDKDNIVTLSNDKEFTLQAGTYVIDFSAPSYIALNTNAWLWSVTDNKKVMQGSTEYGNNSTGMSSVHSTGRYTVTLTEPHTYKIQHYFNNASGKLGNASKSGVGIFTTVDIQKVGTGGASSGGGDYIPETLVWEDMYKDNIEPLRVLDTVYTNTNDVPLYVQITSYSNGEANVGINRIDFQIDGKTQGTSGSNGDKTYDNALYIVPSGSTFVAVTKGTVRLDLWNEAKMPVAVGSGGKTVAFRMGIKDNFPMTDGVEARLALRSAGLDEEIDTDNALIDGKFKPSVAGYYQINGTVNGAGSSPTPSMTTATLYKNGTKLMQGSQVKTNSTDDYTNYSICAVVNTVVYLNGTTDYIELYASANSTSPEITSDLRRTHLSAVLVSGGSASGGDSIWTEEDGKAVYDGVVKSTSHFNTNGDGTAGGIHFKDGNVLISRIDNDMVLKADGADRMKLTANGVTTYQDMTVNGVTVGKGSGTNTTSLGVGANDNTTGDENVGVGFFARKDSTSGNGNVAVGYSSLLKATGNNNTAIGYNSGELLTTGSNNILIGNGVQASAPDVSNEVTIGNVDARKVRFGGGIGVMTLNKGNGTPNSIGFLVDDSGDEPIFMTADKFYAPAVKNQEGAGVPNVAIGTDGQMFKSTATTYTTEEVDKKLAIKDKLIEKLSARLDELEKRVK
jgi:hypothetical protein